MEAKLNSFAHLVREFELFSLGSGAAIRGEISIIKFLFQKKCPGNSNKKELEMRLWQ